MFGSAVTILVGAVLVWTMPAGAEQDGAKAVIGVLGMGFNLIGAGYAVVWFWRERETFKAIWRSGFRR